MRSVERGFTFVELVVVIVILGILAATAVPRFIDVSGDARTAAAQGVAGAIASGTAINYGARLINTANGTAVATCTAAALTVAGGLPAGYTISTTAVAAGETTACTVTGPGGGTATAVITGSA